MKEKEGLVFTGEHQVVSERLVPILRKLNAPPLAAVCGTDIAGIFARMPGGTDRYWMTRNESQYSLDQMNREVNYLSSPTKTLKNIYRSQCNKAKTYLEQITVTWTSDRKVFFQQ